MWDNVLVARLIADAAVAAVTTRVFLEHAGQNTALPYIVLRAGGQAVDQASDGPTGLENPQIACDCYAATANAARDLAEAVAASLDGIRADDSVEGVKSVIVEDKPRTFVLPEDGSHVGYYIVRVAASVWIGD